MAANRSVHEIVVSPNGDTTEGCSGTSSLTTRNFSGQLVRELDYNTPVDDVKNCIWTSVVGKNGDLYGQPSGPTTDNPNYSHAGRNVLAYHGNTLKWKYPTGCDTYTGSTIVGADSNVYFTDNGRLVGVTPDVIPGQTQPRKVLDIPMSSPCYSTELYAYRYGIVAIYDTHATFYTYGGKKIASAPLNAYIFSRRQINVDGQMLFDSYVESGGLRSARISKFDPAQNVVKWTKTVSDNGTYVYSATPFSTADGGTLVALREKRSTGGVLSDELSFTLVKLNSLGVKVWSRTLPTEDAAGNPFGEPRIVVDTNGKVVAVRTGQIKTNDPYNGLMPGISISVFDGANGNILYDRMLRGNIDRASGYVNGYSQAGDPTVWKDTLYLKATCHGSCSQYLDTKLYPIKIPGLGQDYPRGAVLNADMPQQPAAVSYVGLGDSYSSSWGAGKYEVGTATDKNTCRRSANAYAHVLHNNPYSPLRLDGFAACGGATAPRITSPWPNTGDKLNLDEHPQLDTVSSTTRAVTLTMGGNDIGFSDVIKGCVTNCPKAVTTATNKVNTTLAPALTKAYQAILAKAPKAHIYVLGYPPMLSASSPLCVSSAPFNSSAKRTLGIDLLKKLNAKIKATVTVQGSSRLHYLDPTATGSPFIGHDICSANPYMYGVNAPPTDLSGVFHPKPVGQVAYAKLVTSYLATHPLR